MRVLTVKIFPSQKRMEAFVRLDNGKALRIPVEWHSKSAFSPTNWYELVLTEARDFLSKEAAPLQKFLGGQ